MSGDDLYDPLGYDPAAATPRAYRRIPWRRVAAGAASALAAGLAALVWITDDGMGGEPFAIAKIEKAPRVEPQPQANNGANSGEATATIRPNGSRSTAAEIESESGVRVVRRGGDAPGALIIQVPETLGVRLTPAPDRRLVEKGRFGPLPRIGADGSRPAETYARPVVTAAGLKPGGPRIAIVVGGMGLSQSATLNAATRLPGAVTLAFAPYGADLERQAARARESGHEVLLQVPMEPFEPAPSPGPHMLQTAASAEQNLEHLHWLMSRFVGYVGVANFLGAKFMANETAFAPVAREVAGRGLFFLDDASAAQNVVGATAASTGASVLRTDIVIDAVPETIEAELAKLEALARQKGVAIGFATGLPATVEHVARFARGLEKRGIALVPLSSLASFRPAPSAGMSR